MASNNNNNNNNGNKTVVIVGGGLAGAAASKSMADRGYNVDLYEAYPPPLSLSKTSSKAYVISLGSRGQQGLYDATGMDYTTEFIQGGAVISTDIARHVYNSRTQKTKVKVINRYGTKSIVAPRKVLVSCMLNVAMKAGVRAHYQHRLVDVDFVHKIATFESNEKSTSTTIKVRYDLLIGADGSRSALRKLMVAETTMDFTARTEEDSMEYQVAILSESIHHYNNAEECPDGTMHTWNNKEFNAVCLAYPLVNDDDDNNDDDESNDKPIETKNNTVQHSTLFAIIYPEGKLKSFRETDDGYRIPLTALLPDIVGNNAGRLSEIEKQLRENEIANGGLCVWSSSLGHEDAAVVLLGDAGHGMWPSLGQGANCALESVGVFIRCLDELLSKQKKKNDCEKDNNKDNNNWAQQLIHNFDKARLDDATAAVDLTYGGIGARKSRGRMNAPFSYKLQIGGMMLLHKLTFGIFPMPALLRLMAGKDNIRYSTARNYNFYYEKIICLGALLSAVFVCPQIWFYARGSNLISNEL